MGKLTFIRSIVIGIIALFLVATGAYALQHMFRSVPVTVEIIPAMDELELYANGSTVPFPQGIQLAILPRGSTYITEIEMRNGGEGQLDFSVRVNPETVSWGEVSLSETVFSIAPGESDYLTLSTHVYTGASLGEATYTLEFYME